VDDFALVSDMAYVAQNGARILRALFEIALNRNWGPTANVLLTLCKAVDKQMWPFQHPLTQFNLNNEIIMKLDRTTQQVTVEDLKEMSHTEIGNLIRHMRMGTTVLGCSRQFPSLHLEAEIAPITRTVLRMTLYITPNFVWNERVHGKVEPWWIWVEDAENTEILHSEYFLLSVKQKGETQKLGFSIPIPHTDSTTDGLPPQIFVRAISDKWIGAENMIPVSFKNLILPSMQNSIHTELLDLSPLPISALKNPILEEICRKRFQFFNPVQTQIFHTLYYTEKNALIGAPTGSGKTVAAELAMW